MGGVSIFDFFSDRLRKAQCMGTWDSYFVEWVGTGRVGFVVCLPSPPSFTASAWFLLRLPRSLGYNQVKLRPPRSLGS